MPNYRHFVAGLLLLAMLVHPVSAESLKLLDPQHQVHRLQTVIPELSRQRVVFIGEHHDRYHHHLAQKTVIAALHDAAERPWAIGVEFIQQPFQPVLDAYLAKELDETEFLAQSEYFERWRFDYRLYQPIFRYAREHGIPMVALNIASELIDAVRQQGLDGLSAEQRAQLPQDFLPVSEQRRTELEQIYRYHPQTSGDFERFLLIQQLWDAGMAERAAQYLQAHPEHGLIVLAGSGHMAPGSGIPQYVRPIMDVPMQILLPVDAVEPGAVHGADYLLLAESLDLPPAGRMGVQLDFNGGAYILDVLADSAAAHAGLQVGDQILSIDEKPVTTWTDVRLALLNRSPGDEMTVTLQRVDAVDPLTLTLILSG